MLLQEPGPKWKPSVGMAVGEGSLQSWLLFPSAERPEDATGSKQKADCP